MGARVCDEDDPGPRSTGAATWLRLAPHLPMALILLLGGCFWLQRLGVNDHDDAVSNEVLFAREPLAVLLFRMKWADQSPLYFVLLHFWRGIGDSPLAVECLNLIQLLASLFLLHRLARRLFRSPLVAHGTLLLAAVSPASLWVVRNGRMYSLQLVLSLACLVCLARYADERRPRDLVFFVIASVLNVYNHFFGLLITACLLAWLLLELGIEARRGAPHARELPPARRAPRAVLLAATVILLAALQNQGLGHRRSAGSSPPGHCRRTPGYNGRSLRRGQRLRACRAP